MIHGKWGENVFCLLQFCMLQWNTSAVLGNKNRNILYVRLRTLKNVFKMHIFTEIILTTALKTPDCAKMIPKNELKHLQVFKILAKGI